VAPTAPRVLVAVLALVIGTAVVLTLTTAGHGAKGPSRRDYLAQARMICREYNARLDRIPPIQDPTLLGNVIESANAAIPMLSEQARRIEALTPPRDLRASVARFFALTDRSIATLKSVRRAARHLDSAHVGLGLIRFGKESTAAKLVGRRIGYRC
jgi:hypothetical protein